MREIVAFAFIIIGIWTALDPNGAVAFKMKALNTIGVKIKVNINPKGYKVLRYIGIALAILGFLLV